MEVIAVEAQWIAEVKVVPARQRAVLEAEARCKAEAEA